jgi:phosphatidylglycerol:prolipoprotein diacylglycerol transferase
MLPEILHVGPVTIHSFGLMLAIGFLLIAWLSSKEFTRRGFSADAAGSCTLGAMIGGVLGAKLYYLVDHWSAMTADPLGTIFSGSGLTYYGGFIGGALGVLLVGRRYKVPLMTLVDMGAPLVALGYGVGRIGCFLNGDDYGKVSNLPWAMAFPKGTPPTLERVQPTQLYEIVASLAIFFFLWSRRGKWDDRPGFTFGLYLMLGGTERFLVEFVRLNLPVALGLTLAQWISIGLFLLGLFLIRRPRRA